VAQGNGKARPESLLRGGHLMWRKAAIALVWLVIIGVALMVRIFERRR
jgi:hypothetical protein